MRLPPRHFERCEGERSQAPAGAPDIPNLFNLQAFARVPGRRDEERFQSIIDWMGPNNSMNGSKGQIRLSSQGKTFFAVEDRAVGVCLNLQGKCLGNKRNVCVTLITLCSLHSIIKIYTLRPCSFFLLLSRIALACNLVVIVTCLWHSPGHLHECLRDSVVYFLLVCSLESLAFPLKRACIHCKLTSMRLADARKKKQNFNTIIVKAFNVLYSHVLPWAYALQTIPGSRRNRQVLDPNCYPTFSVKGAYN